MDFKAYLELFPFQAYVLCNVHHMFSLASSSIVEPHVAHGASGILIPDGAGIRLSWVQPPVSSTSSFNTNNEHLISKFMADPFVFP